MLHGRSRVERPGAQCGGIARGQDSGVIILSAVPASWASTARSIQAAGVELVHTNVEVHLFGVDGFALLDEPVLCASRPDRLLIDVARLGELITPDTRMDSMVGRMAFPEASGLVVSALTMLGVDGWWREADTPPIAEWGAARTLAQLVCEANFASAHRSERMLLQSALAVSAPLSPAMSQRQLARLLLSEILPRADFLILPVNVVRGARTWLTSQSSHEAVSRCVSLWRHARQLDLTDSTAWRHLGRDFDAAVELVCGDMPDAQLTHSIAKDIIEPIERVIAQAAVVCRDAAARFDEDTESSAMSPSDRPDASSGYGGVGLPHHRMLRYSIPTESERAARDQFAARLTEASYRSPGIQSTPVPYPAGRLNTRELVRLSAQMHLGLAPTAKPWTARVMMPRARVRLTFALIFDASLSMSPWTHHAGPLGWSIAAAVNELGGSCTVRGFGGGSFEVVRPGTAPVNVPRVVDTGSGSDGCDLALDHAVADSRILTQTGARVVVVLTDGKLPAEDATGIDRTVGRLRDAGVVVLWVLTSARVAADVVPDRAIVLTSVTPESFIDVVSRTVVEELAHT